MQSDARIVSNLLTNIYIYVCVVLSNNLFIRDLIAYISDTFYWTRKMLKELHNFYINMYSIVFKNSAANSIILKHVTNVFS